MKSFNTILRSVNLTASEQSKDFDAFEKIQDPVVELPQSFDGISIWAEYLSEIKNQKNCGACLL